jgi:hypothetical protein
MRRLERHERYLLLVGPPFVAFVTWASADCVHDTFRVGWLVSYLAAPLIGVVTVAGLVGARTVSTRNL